MSTLIWIIVFVVLLALLIRVILRRMGRMFGGVDPTQLLFDPELIGRVRALAEQGQTIPAIKVLRDGTPGLGLASAKQMVDRMASRASADTPEMLPSASSVPLEVELQARSMKSAGQEISAIKLIRGHTSWGLREAKEYVDGL